MLQATDYKPQLASKPTKVDRLVRWVVIPLVFVIGLYGLLRYAVAGEGNGIDATGQPTSEAAISR